MNKELIKKAREFVTDYYRSNFSRDRLFHSIMHTHNVVTESKELAKAYNLDKQQIAKLEIAALFHDIGYAEAPERHEAKSAELMTKFCQDNKINASDISDIQEIILATHKEATPEGLLQEIIKDADCSHLGKDNYFSQGDLLRREWQLMGGPTFSDKEWIQENIQFLESHKFYTQHADIKWGKYKTKNLAKLNKQLAKSEFKNNPVNSAVTPRVIPDKLGRGVETMYRVTLRNHNSLSRIADNKASIMLSINAIMISVIMASLIPKLDNNPNLIWPTLILITVCLSAITLAILSARPNYKVGKYDKESFLNKKFNVLFFGNFHSMKLDEFEWALEELIKDESLLYSCLSKDLYFLGVVMLRKYQLLRWCYNVFMYGIIISAIAFVIGLMMGNPMIDGIIIPQ